MSQNPKDINIIEKCLEITINESQANEIPELQTFIEDFFSNNFYNNHEISLKVLLPESLLDKFNKIYFPKIFETISIFKDGNVKDVQLILNLIKNKPQNIMKMKDLSIPDDPKEREDFFQGLTIVIPSVLNFFQMEIKITSGEKLKRITEIIQKINKQLETLNLMIDYDSNELTNLTPFLGNTLESFINLKTLQLNLKNFGVDGDYFKNFFQKLPQMKNIICLDLSFERMLLNDQTLTELFLVLTENRLQNLNSLKLIFKTVKLSDKTEFFSNFFNKICNLNVLEFKLGFIEEDFTAFESIFQSMPSNEKIQRLEFLAKTFDFTGRKICLVEQFISKFPKIKFLELKLINIRLAITHNEDFCKIFDLPNVIQLEYLRLILPYNNINDEFMKNLLKKMECLINLRYLFLDFQQSWQASFYFNDGVKENVISFLNNLVNLQSVLINFDGNELKRDSTNGYQKIEDQLEKMKNEHKKLKYYKLLERYEVEIPENKFANENCHLRYEYFFNDFYGESLANTNENSRPMILGNFEMILKECELQDNYVIYNTEAVFNEKRFKTIFKDMKIVLENPLYNPSDKKSMANREKFDGDLKRSFKQYSIKYSFFFYDNSECKFVTPPALKIEEEFKEIEEVKTLKSKDFLKINKLLADIISLNGRGASIIAKTPIFVELLCQNEDILVNFSVQHFEKIMKNFNPDDSRSINLFLNQIFSTTLNVNMESEIPAIILSTKGYCKYLTCESFAFLSFYAKNVSKIEVRANLSEKQKLVHKKKIASITTLEMQENQYFSTRSCKETLLSLIDNKWRLIKLRSPDYFYDNDNFLIQTKKDKKFARSSKKIQYSINEFYSHIREAIKDFELVELDDFYGDFILNLFANLPNLKDINVSNLNLGDKFCEGFNTFIAAEKKKLGHYRFINLEILNNIRITNVGLKFLYVSYQIMRNHFKQKCSEVLPKLKVFAVLLNTKKKTKFHGSPMNIFKRANKDKQDLKPLKIMKKIKRKKNKLPEIKMNNLIKKSDSSGINQPNIYKEDSQKFVIDINSEKKDEKIIDNRGVEDEWEEVEVTDDEATNKNTLNLQILLENEEKVKNEKILEEQKQLEEKMALELSKKNLDDTSETIILNEGLGAFIQSYIKGLSRPKRFFCYNCDSEVCKECHTLHHKFKECQPEFIICEKCGEIHHKNLVDCKIEDQDQIICRGFRQILTEKKKNSANYRIFRMFKKRNKSSNKCLTGFEKCFLQAFGFILSLYYYSLELSKKCIMGVRKQFENCCVPSTLNEKGEKIAIQGKCLSFLNCFFGDPDSIDDEVKEFKFNKNVIDLNHSLGSRRLLLLYSLNFIIYYFLVGFVPVYFRGEETVEWNSHYIYACYAFLVFIFETYLTYFIIRKVNFGKGNKILKDFSLANYFLPLLLSQIKKYDFYTDMVFIITNINRKRSHIAIISGVFLLITTSMNLILILSLLKTLWNFSFRKVFCFCFFNSKNKKKVVVPASKNSISNFQANTTENNDKFSTFMVVKKVDNEASNRNINLFCKVSSLLELECIGNCLDKFSTKNAWFFPYFGGYYIPQQIISSTLKFIFEDLPSFIIQVFVIAYYDNNSSSSYIIPIIITTCISLLASVMTVLTAKASILKSDELKDLEKEKFEKWDEENKKKEEEIIEENHEKAPLNNENIGEISMSGEKNENDEKKSLILEKKNS